MTTLGLPLFTPPATHRALSEARAVAILIGSYDGSGNYGDIAQLDAGLQLLSSLDPGLLVLPVLERSRLQGHLDLLDAFQRPPEHAVFFDPEHAGQDELQPLAVPPTLASAAIYLYGGGYLNPFWGVRKLAMVRTAEDLLRAAGIDQPVRLSSGLQVDQGWLNALDPDDAALLRSFDYLGVRDPLSARALASLDSAATVVDTGDDALGAIPIPAPAGDGVKTSTSLDVNLHFGEHPWISDRPAELRDHTLDFVTELGRRSGRPVRMRPLIAYMDSRIDERPEATALAAEATRRGIEVQEQQVIRPSALGTILPELRGADATISCSYHVALTSLLLGIPTVFFADNPYYEQKAAGLLTAFGLPPCFAFSPGSDLDPVIDAILDDAGNSLRSEIVRRGEERRRRRAGAETELLGRLAGGVMAKLAAEVEELGEQLQKRSSEPARLQVELSALRTETEELRRPAVEAAITAAERRTDRAEAHARQAEEDRARCAAENAAAHQRLAEIFASRTWKLGAPLRRIGAALRRLF